jgi:hypothetical protein
MGVGHLKYCTFKYSLNSKFENDMKNIKDIEPNEVWQIFDQMLQIPRPSNMRKRFRNGQLILVKVRSGNN